MVTRLILVLHRSWYQTFVIMHRSVSHRQNNQKASFKKNKYLNRNMSFH